MNMVEYVINKGATFKDGDLNLMVEMSGINSTIIILYFIISDRGCAVSNWLKCASFRSDIESEKLLQALTLITNLYVDGDIHRRQKVIAICKYIMKHSNHFGGEILVCNHITNSNASRIILNLKRQNPTRKNLIQMAKKHQIELALPTKS